MKKIFTLLVFNIFLLAVQAQLPGNSIHITANGQGVNIPDATGATVNTDMTIEADIYYTCANGSSAVSVLTKGWCGASWSYDFEISDNYLLFTKFRPGGNCNTGYVSYTSADRIPFNTWTHIAVVMTGSTIAFYINGVFSASAITIGSAFTGIQLSGEPVRIAMYKNLGGSLVSSPLSNIDEVRIWHIARSAAQILANYNTTLAGNEPGLYCYWKLDETGSGAGITCLNSATATGATFNGTTQGAGTVFSNNNTVINTIPICSPMLWLRADSTLTKDGSNRVSQWNDVSGNNKHATQAITTNQPVWMPNVFNGKPALWFDGVNGNYFLENTTQTPVATAGSARTYFVVAKADCNAQGYKGGTLFSNRRTSQASTAEFSDNGSGGVYYANNLCCTHPSTNTPFAKGQQIFTGTWRTSGTGTNIDFWMNGIATTTSNGNFVIDNGGAGYAVGDRRDGTTGQDWQGYIAEIIVYSRAVSDAEKLATETYLKNKYNTTYLPSQFTKVPVIKTNNDLVLDDASWKHSYNSADPSSLIVSVKDNCLDLGAITDTVYLEPGIYGQLPTGDKFLRRHFVVKTQNNPAGTKRVRLYFTVQEFNDLKTATGINTIADLSVTKYQGPTEDGNYFIGDATNVTYIPSSSIVSGSLFGQYYLEFDITGFSEFWIHGGTTILPLRLLNFTAVKKSNDVNLQWQTEDEVAVDRFEVEKSVDGIHFYKINSLPAKNGLQNNYACTDVNADMAKKGIAFYRLKQVELPGNYFYSNIVKIAFGNKAAITISPLPAKDMVTIRSSEAISKIQVLNSAGQAIKSWQPNTLQQYMVSDLPNGLYFIVITKGETQQAEKMVIER